MISKKTIYISFFLSFCLAFSFFAFVNVSKVIAATASDYQNTPETNPGFQIVPDCNNYVSAPGTPGQSQECGWYDLLQLIKNVMAFLLYLSAFLATMSFVYAGFLYLTAFGEMGKVEQAHGIFTKVALGLVFVFLAWLIVATILSALGVSGAFSLLDISGIPKLNLRPQ